MKEWFSKLSGSVKIALLMYALAVLSFALLIPFFFFQMMDIPLGAFLGGTISGTMYLLSSLAEASDAKKGNATLTIMMQGMRFIVVAGVMVVISLMYFKWDMKIFNPFAYIALYTVSVVVNVIVMLRERNK